MKEMKELDITHQGTGIQQADYSIGMIKDMISNETAIRERLDMRLAKKAVKLFPFSMDLDYYVRIAASDVFTERWEKSLAFQAMQGAMEWKNTEYRKHKAEFDKIKAERNAHIENIRILKENMQRLKRRVRRLRDNEEQNAGLSDKDA